MRWYPLVVTLAAACGDVTASPIDAGGDGAVAVDAATDASARATADRPDEVNGYQVHALYVLASDGVDRGLDVDGTVARSLTAATRWFAQASGGPRLRVDTIGGVPDVTFVRVNRTAAELAANGSRIRDELERLLDGAGQLDPRKLYAVYYDGAADGCGGAPLPPALVGRVNALFLDGSPGSAQPCRNNPLASGPDAPGYFELILVRGMMHALGAVPACAPHQLGGDVNDSPADILYRGAAPWVPTTIDVGRDDYWGHGRAACLDLARSAFLDPLPPSAQVPPGW